MTPSYVDLERTVKDLHLILHNSLDKHRQDTWRQRDLRSNFIPAITS